MLTPVQSDRKVTSNMQGKQFAMGIHVDAVAHIMENLAGLYSDQLTAMLREYATNGIDATIMAGHKRPIEVTLPKALAPMLTIRDYGIGLSAEDLEETYSQYGASTKRDSNDFNGTLGFGCKSALAYSDTFTVTSVKDGLKTYAMVAKDEDGIPKFTVVDQQMTTEPSGTSVEIPVGSREDQRAVAEKAQRLYSYFDPGTVLVDGREPAMFLFDSQIDKYTWVTKRQQDSYYSYRSGNEPQQSYIVMGNVPYPAEINHGLAVGYGVVVKVPIGAVEFSPSRESLKMNKATTKNTIAAIEARLQKHFKTIVQREVDAAKTKVEVVRVVQKWTAALRFDPNPQTAPLKYRGHDVVKKLSAGPMPPTDQHGRYTAPIHEFIEVLHSSSRLSSHGQPHSVSIERIMDSVWVKNFDPATFTATMKKKLIAWARIRCNQGAGDLPPTYYILCKGDPPAFWTDDCTIIDYQTDVKPIKLAKAQVKTSNGRIRPTGSYDGWVDGVTAHIQAGDIDVAKPIFWLQGTTSSSARCYQSILKRAHPGGFTLVYMPGNRVEKFKRDFPTAIPALAGCEQAYAAWVKSLTIDQQKALYMRASYMTANLKRLASYPGKIKDPAVVEGMRLAKIPTDKLVEAQIAFQYVVALGNFTVAIKDPLERYPLVRNIERTGLDHVALYINAAYDAYQRGVLK